jgi:tyrosinase
MSATDRIAYTDAVKCLHSLPPKSSPADVPGARSRFDDFVAAHIEQAYNIHFGGNLFVWHRAYTWYFETALREECGYQGTQPYWDWSLYADDPASSPLFDGSATSIGGNGESIVHGPTLLKAFGLEVSLPPGTGGGCVTQGPMANWTVWQ